MISVILSLALAATAANGADTPPAKAAKPKKVCTKVEVTGSTVPKRVCRIVAEPAPQKEEAHAADHKPETGATN
ncbi:hypothetical protein E5675_13060 [Sphingopyxis sp. PAMC25046]|uniref:hypothetical protein n=1 Tax=Sphingopyxis sp. PAMC25046 TaxID=2565556 RepID=UPI00109D9FFC|nr:hypothetical protein [Sphingopyxis sp. PAMC25046]QCB55267.1 hypothetical protein E5675_13060 [Sphingopyxis sp. PAMC25046]